MILPQTHAVALLLMIASILCWGLWANTLKMDAKWRYELYYFDFAIGLALAALLFGLTLGDLGFDGFSLQDDLMHAGKREWLYAFGAGVLFNFGNEFLAGGIAVAGMTAAFPAGIGLALVMGALLNQLTSAGRQRGVAGDGLRGWCSSPRRLAGSYAVMQSLRHEEQARAGKSKDTKRRLSPRRSALAGGVFLNLFSPGAEGAGSRCGAGASTVP